MVSREVLPFAEVGGGTRASRFKLIVTYGPSHRLDQRYQCSLLSVKAVARNLFFRTDTGVHRCSHGVCHDLPFVFFGFGPGLGLLAM